MCGGVFWGRQAALRDTIRRLSSQAQPKPAYTPFRKWRPNLSASQANLLEQEGKHWDPPCEPIEWTFASHQWKRMAIYSDSRTLMSWSETPSTSVKNWTTGPREHGHWWTWHTTFSFPNGHPSAHHRTFAYTIPTDTATDPRRPNTGKEIAII